MDKKFKVYTDPYIETKPILANYRGITSDWCLCGWFVDGRSSRWWCNEKTGEKREYQGQTDPEDCPIIKRD